jgi:Ca2+-binding EF-hand superfamily protein
MASGVTIHQGLFEDFYSYFKEKDRSEIDVDLFIECATLLKIPIDEARNMFRAFDADNSGSLSIIEITVGFAKIFSGSLEDKLLMAFNAYVLSHLYIFAFM